jgi:hypothetical protein
VRIARSRNPCSMPDPRSRQPHVNTDFLDHVRQFGRRATDRSRPPTEPLDMVKAAELARPTGRPLIGPPVTEDEAGTMAGR